MNKLDSSIQAMRIKFIYSDGTVDYAMLPSINIMYRRSGDGTYKVN